ncbi:flap endonuclease GEN homolog 1-like [Mytilus californianus]|uniref:flap endonuclease GEN homolog 1-like n=1 Tax=Mytilus californianus TaxID=6549 RepID=UPI0022453621|nr:flap endonuclease GEN homolog 1-like [Mytilus californianus]
MGVTNLWQILSPIQQHKPLSSLKGQTVAIDLSIWVCENQCVKQMQGVVTRPYLRNLYFRISCLLQLGINLIFAVEGEAPDLKQETMSRRQEVQYPGKRKGPPNRKKSRSHFNAKLRECCEMLDYLGVPYIQSRGEAEALCGLLNAAGIVDGCITNDGDVFLYGAKTVFRNFSITSKDPQVEIYSICDIEQKLDLNREKMVALALLVGCDYVPKGVPGVGIEKASKLLAGYKDISPLRRFKSWKRLSDAECLDAIEVQIKRKAALVSDFPQKRIIDEFMIPKDHLPSRHFKWNRPKLVLLQTFSLCKLEWPEEYTQDKLLPLITLWDMTDISKGGQHGHLVPYRIVKARVRHGIPSVEVEWHKQADDHICQTDYYVTIEDRELFSQCFHQLIEEFEIEAAKKKSKSKGRKKKVQDAENVDMQREQTDVDVLTDKLDSLQLKPLETRKITPEEHISSKRNNLQLKSMTTGKITGIGDVLSNEPCEGEEENLTGLETSVALKFEDKSSSSFEDTSEIEVSYAEENLSLRSRLTRKTSASIDLKSECDFNLKNLHSDQKQITDFVDSENESEIDLSSPAISHLNPNIEVKDQISDCDVESKFNYQKENCLSCTPDTNVKSAVKFIDLSVLTPEKEKDCKRVSARCQPDLVEDSSMKIYDVSDFSHIGRLNFELNTPNMSRLKNLSPSLYQTLLESTPTSSSKLRKAALLKSILNSPLQVERILNKVGSKNDFLSPLSGHMGGVSSAEKSLNISKFSINGSMSDLGNFQIESSLLKSIIASGGSITTSPHFEQPKNDQTPLMKVQKDHGIENSNIHTPAEKNIVSKLAFDENSPLIPFQGNLFQHVLKGTSKMCKSDFESPCNHMGNSAVIDLTCETPKYGKCRTVLDLDESCYDIKSKKSSSAVEYIPDLPDASINLKPIISAVSVERNKENFVKRECNATIKDLCENSITKLNPSDNVYFSDFELEACDQRGKESGRIDSEFGINYINLPNMDNMDKALDSTYELSTPSREEKDCNFSSAFLVDKDSSKIFDCSPSLQEKENTIDVHTEINHNVMKLGTKLDLTFEEKSPVSLADRLRRKLNVTSMKGVLQEVTGN